MSATTEQKFEELRRAYDELQKQHNAALAELQARPAAPVQRSNGDAHVGHAAHRDVETLSTENEELRAAQAAGLEVLQAMVASPGDTQPVFDLIAQQAAKLCDVPHAVVAKFDGALIHLVTHTGMEPATAEVLLRQFPRPPGQDIALGRAILNGRIEQIEDITDGSRAFVPPPGQGSVLAVPLLRDGAPLGAIAIGREERGPFPKNQITLLQTFAEQAVIAIGSAETYRELQERTTALARRNSEYGERIEQQAATIDVLTVMSASPGDPQPVFDLIANRARAFCEADGAMVTLLEDGMLRLRTHIGATQAASAAYEAFFPCPVDDSTTLGRAVLTRAPVHNPDLLGDPGYRMKAITSVNLVRSNAAVPILRSGAPIGAIGINWLSVGQFPTAQLELLKTFAEQAAIAITSAETFRMLQTRTRDLQESLDYQTATSDVLKVISRSTFDLQPVLDTVVETAARLCNAEMAMIFRREGDVYRVVTNLGFPPEFKASRLAQGAIHPDPKSVTARAVRERRAVHEADVATDSDYPVDSITLGRQRTSLGVPLLRDGEPVGVILLARQRVEPFTDQQIELVSTFADQAVIAIENTRLITEQREALEQQTATAEVLGVINASPGNLKPVFDAILEKAHSLCGATRGAFVILHGEEFQVATARGLSDRYVQILREAHQNRTPSDELSPREQLLKGADFVQKSGPAIYIGPIRLAGAELENVHAVLFVPLRQDGKLLGYITAYREHQSLFSDKQITVLQSFAAQAVVAMENARLLNELHEALDQQTATAEVLQVINASPGNLVPVFDAVLDKALVLCGSPMGTLATYDGEFFHTAAQRGSPQGFVDLLREPFRPTLGLALERLVQGETLIHTLDLTADEMYLSGNPRHRALTDQSGARTAVWIALRRDNTLLGMINIYRREVRPFTNKQIALLQSFAAQAVIAMENARLINETREALEQQTATAEVLQIINSSPGDLKPVFDAVLEKALRLCAASFGTLLTVDGERLERVALLGVPPAFAAWGRQNPLTKDAALIARGFHTRKPVQAVDVMTDPFLADTPNVRDALVNLGGVRALLQVPLLKDGAVQGFIGVFRKESGAFPEKQVALLEGFAAQAVIAMDNARLLTEQREALEQQTATAEILRVINASPGNLTPVFDALLERALHLCESSFGILCTFDGEFYHTVATRDVAPEYADLARAPVRPIPGMCAHDLVLGKNVVHLADVTTDARYDLASPFRRALADHSGARTAIWVALRHDNALLGMINIFRSEVRPYSDQQIALLQNFASQAVIAMENARLLNEQREALEQQTATAEVLQVINASPGNLTPVFEAILEKAYALCGVGIGALEVWDGKRIRAVATRGLPPAFVEVLQRGVEPEPDNPHWQLVDGAGFFHFEDQASYSGPTARRAVEVAGLHTVLGVALRKDGVLLGRIVAARQEVRPFTDKEITLLKNFADQAVIAMDNARLLNEVRQHQEELRVTFENMGDGVAMFNGTQHLVAWNGKFQQIFDLPDELLKQHRTYEDHLRFLAERGYFSADVDMAERIHTLVASTGQSYGYERTLPDGRVIEIRRNPVPDGGFVLIFSDITERKRSEEEIRAARDAAEAAYRDLKTAQASLIQAEKMASLGQLTAGIAHEIKNPLNFVNNFASLSVDLLDELKQAAAPGLAVLDGARRTEVDDLANTLASNLVKINEHGRRADGIVRSMLEHSRGSSGERRSVDLNALVDEALNLAYHGARAQDQTFNISLQRQLGEGIPPITLAPQDITRVLLNLFSNGFYAARERHRAKTTSGFQPSLKVSTRQVDDAVEIRVRDNGIGIPSEIKDRLFQPFFTTKPPGEGTGLGLSMSYDIITQQHGGSISVDSKAGEYSEFTIRLPRSA